MGLFLRDGGRAVVALGLLLLGGCDFPTEEPSFDTKTDLNSPLVAEQTFSFLGGPKSEFEPLVDTTTSTFDSLFTVGAENDVSIVQEIDNFDIRSLDEALDDASGDLVFEEEKFKETFIDLGQKEGASFSGERKIEEVTSEEERDISTEGTITVSGSDRVAFDPANDDYVELGETRVAVQEVTVSPNAEERVYDTLKYIYPDIRLEPYEPDDSLVVAFVQDPCGQDPCESGDFQRDINTLKTGFDLSLLDVRAYPDKKNINGSGKINYVIKGKANERLMVEDDDEVSLETITSVREPEIQALSVSAAKPFNVTVTPNANGGDIDIADDAEVETAAFNRVDSFTDRVDGLRLANASLDLTVMTQNVASTNAQLYAAIQGTRAVDAQDVFLAGTKDQNSQREAENRDVSSFPFGTDFVEGGRPVDRDSLIRLGIDLEDAGLRQRVADTLPVDEDNSTVTNFVSALPTAVRFAGQARLNTDGGDLEIRRPIEMGAGLTLDVPLRIDGEFVLRETIDADFSGLQDLTDPDANFTVEAITFEFGYENGLPLGADAQFTIVDERGVPVRTIPGESTGNGFDVDPAPKDPEDGTADGTTGRQTTSLSLGSSREDLRRLADGEEIQLRLRMTQASAETAASLRADDRIAFDLQVNVDASIGTGD